MRPRRRRLWGVLAVTALMSAVLVATSQPSAATTTKGFSASCVGADDGSKTVLGLIGDGTINAPIQSVAEVPQFVEPGQTGVPYTLTWSLQLDPSLAEQAAAVASGVSVSNTEAAITIDGPTSSAGNIPAKFPDQSFALEPGKAISSTFPPLSGTLDDIGNAGIIKIKTTSLKFTIQLQGVPADLAAVAGGPINLACSTGATLASIPVKIAGSPDIVQPIDVETSEGASTEVDVLAQYVTNGVTKEGVEMPVDPSTLKVVDGPGEVVNGKVVATGPAAGSTADVTFEVCAGTVEVATSDPGTSEVQEIRMYYDPVNRARRQIGVDFAFGAPVQAEGQDAAAKPSGQPVWSAKHARAAFPFTARDAATYPNGTAGSPGQFLTGPAPVPWEGTNVNTYAWQSEFAYPTAAAVQAALESVPSIGAGNVTVTEGAPTKLERPAWDDFDAYQKNVLGGLFGQLEYMPYEVEFTGELANKALDKLSVNKMYSFLPNEIKQGLSALLSAGGGDGGSTKTPIPGADGVPDIAPADGGPIEGNAKTYLDYLQNTAASITPFDPFDLTSPSRLDEWSTTIELYFTVLGENPMSLIDLQFATAWIDLVFQRSPSVDTLVEGEDPTKAEIQELCAQGVLTLTSAGGEEPPASETPTGSETGGDGTGGTGGTDGTPEEAKLAFTG